MLERMDAFFDSRLDGYEEHQLTCIESARDFYPFTANCLPHTPGMHILDLGVGTGLELRYYFEKIPDAWLRIPHSYTALYYRSHGVFMTAASRDSLLIDNPDIVISDKIRITDTQTGKTCLLYGFDVNFSYAGSNFCWNRDGYVYLMAKDNENIYLEKRDGNNKYYRCEASQLNENTFLSELQKLVMDYEHS